MWIDTFFSNKYKCLLQRIATNRFLLNPQSFDRLVLHVRSIVSSLQVDWIIIVWDFITSLLIYIYSEHFDINLLSIFIQLRSNVVSVMINISDGIWTRCFCPFFQRKTPVSLWRRVSTLNDWTVPCSGG